MSPRINANRNESQKMGWHSRTYPRSAGVAAGPLLLIPTGRHQAMEMSQVRHKLSVKRLG
jgi:hypothetical protein